MNSHLIEFINIIHLNKWDKDKIKTSIERHTSIYIYKWWIQIYATWKVHENHIS